MEKTKLFIHIGLHKTATTSFQYLLNNIENKNFYKKNNINVIRQNRIEECKQNHINIISFESFITPKFNKIFYNNTKIIEENSVENVNDRINIFKKNIGYDLDVQIICVLREQASYIESFYLQQVKTNLIKEHFDIFKKKINFDDFYYSTFINEMKKYFCVHCLWYETILMNDTDTSFKPLFNILGLGEKFDELPIKTCKKNINIDASSTDIFIKADWCNREFRKKHISEKIEYHKNLFTESEYIEISEKFYEDNRKLHMPNM